MFGFLLKDLNDAYPSNNRGLPLTTRLCNYGIVENEFFSEVTAIPVIMVGMTVFP